MKPVVALVGRPNVGKSTLFNCLTRSRDAIVADQPGLTRDRQFGEGKVGDRSYLVVDTGGLTDEKSGVDALMALQSWRAIEQADLIFFMVDARAGLLPADISIAQRLRTTGKSIYIVANKTDGLNPETVKAEFSRLGFAEVLPITAAHGEGVAEVMEYVLGALPIHEDETTDVADTIKVAIIGRPNVGKSTLVNRMLGEDRVITYDLPGTTRDSIYLPFTRDAQHYMLIDTAGVRRRARVEEGIEKFSVIKTLQAIDDAHVVIVLLDAQEGITDQDANLLGIVLQAGKAIVLAINKWDGLQTDQRSKVIRELDLKLAFVTFAKAHFISALHGSGVGDLYGTINKAYRSAFKKVPTPQLTKLLLQIVTTNPPPIVRGRRIKLRYAHMGGMNPPVIVIHGNQTQSVPDSYTRYLMNSFRKQLRMEGTPLAIEYRTGENPYKDKKNTLTKRQVAKRQRLKRFVKR
ncbi:MAG: ribosome biogenesis GTPase Der [Gammaproteobacteria bacterium]|nr:ribosome biogenesis GTPase Der [Gammaproteobacteria bacterium]